MRFVSTRSRHGTYIVGYLSPQGREHVTFRARVETPKASRRHVGLLTVSTLLSSLLAGTPVAQAGDLEQIETLEAVARAAYASRDFDEAILALTEVRFFTGVPRVGNRPELDENPTTF